VEEVGERPRGSLGASGDGLHDPPVPLVEIDPGSGPPLRTGICELDRVLSGGLVPGSVTLLGGEPGIGKSTLLLQALGSMAARGRRVMLVSGEESPRQVRLRAERLGALLRDLWLLSETSMPRIQAAIEEVEPEAVVVDSVQSIFDPDIGSVPGSAAQVRECACRLVRIAKARSVATAMVGHLTKDGSLAGPMLLEHVVDSVLSFEGDRHHAVRLLRALKHRFGPTGELGLFEMCERGLKAVPDPSRMLLGDRRRGLPGSSVVPLLEGRRALLVEIQALVTRSRAPSPGRSTKGLDSGRLALVLAVLERRVGLALSALDVFASAVGGVKVAEPAADLALALALVSASSGVAIGHDLVACGELGLGGEVRQVANTPRRLAEAARVGFRRAVVPASVPEAPPGMEVTRVATFREAMRAVASGSLAEGVVPAD
jgi:DNA repair protein RadA/Sms